MWKKHNEWAYLTDTDGHGTFKLRVVMWKSVIRGSLGIMKATAASCVKKTRFQKPSAGFGLEEDQTPELGQKPTLHSWDNCHDM